MDGQNNNTVPVEPQALPVCEAVEVAVAFEEKVNHVGGDGGVAVSELSGKRKRGRPRKHPLEVRQEFMVVPESKRGRGRPKGSGKWQTMAAPFGGRAMDSAGSNFTVHTIVIQRGENIVQRICSFTQSASESMCILSACGTVSSAEVLRPGSCGGILRYEGRFEIVSLNGSHSNNETGGVRDRIFLLSVQLANPDCSLFGGAVAGSLIAGGPIMLVIATFRQNVREKLPVRHSTDSSKPNNGAVAAPLHNANGKLQDAQVNGLTIVSPVPAPPIVGVDKVVSDSDVNRASPHPFEWNSLQSCSVMSQHLISELNAGNTDQ